MQHSEPANGDMIAVPPFSDRELAARLAALGPRQREIADIVYTRSAATPREVQGHLSEVRSIRVVRTLLDRMAAKGLVRRRPANRPKEYVYVAAVLTAEVKEAAVKKVVAELFQGSWTSAQTTIDALARRDRLGRVPRTAVIVKRRANERPEL